MAKAETYADNKSINVMAQAEGVLEEPAVTDLSDSKGEEKPAGQCQQEEVSHPAPPAIASGPTMFRGQGASENTSG